MILQPVQLAVCEEYSYSTLDEMIVHWCKIGVCRGVEELWESVFPTNTLYTVQKK